MKHIVKYVLRNSSSVDAGGGGGGGGGSYSRQMAPGDEFHCGGNEDNNSLNTDKERRGSGITIVELRKKDGATLGLIISGGVDKGSRPRISNLRAGGLAYRSDALSIGDNIISVNGIRTAKLKHDEIINLLKNADGHVTLEVEYELPFFPSENSPCVCPKVIQVRLEKENGSFGFVLRGGAAYGCPLTVTYVRPGGPADREGTIKAGDRLLVVDGINLFPCTQAEATAILKRVEDEGVFTIEYDVSLMEAVRNASGPLLVEIERGSSGNQQLGVALSSSSKEPSSILIQSIKQASLAERCGALHVGDRVLAIDDVSLEGTTAAEASQLLKNCCGDKIRLEILPLSQMYYGKRLPEVSIRKGTSMSSFATLGSVYRHPQNRVYDWRPQRSMEASPSSSSLPSFISSCSASISPPLCRSETTDVTLCADQRGFGFALQISPSLAPPIVGSLDQGGAAERSGVIQVGDRILFVNGISVEGCSVEDVTGMLLSSKPRVNLKIEFDVAESVVPSSGIFDVKLPCKGSGGLGITITASKDRRLGDIPIISDVRRGGVAHRTGTIHIGDRLLAIGSVNTDEYSLEDAVQFLKDCREEVVRLRIRKDDLQAVQMASPAVSVTTRIETKSPCSGILKGDDNEECESNDWIVYSVELVRRDCGPLGITVSGSEEPYRPVIVSALTEGGLAQQTGALHVGDRLLAVNGTILRDKTLGNAIQLLQNSGDVVTLKVARSVGINSERYLGQDDSLSPKDDLDGGATPLPSIDSAVESWDESMATFDGHSSGHGGITMVLRNHKRNSARTQTSSLIDGDVFAGCTVEEDGSDIEGTGLAEEIGNWQRRCRASNGSVDDDWPNVSTDLNIDDKRAVNEVEEEEEERKESGAEVDGTTEGVVSMNLRRRQSDEALVACLQSRQVIGGGSDISSLMTTSSLVGGSSGGGGGPRKGFHTNTLPHGGRNSRRRHGFEFDVSRVAVPSCSGEDDDGVSYPIEVHRVTLFKDTVYEDFGFSVSDGLYERGVYVNRIRPGGPAEIGGILRSFDRILQVNDTKTHDFDCCLTVPLIAAAGDRIRLVVVRNPYTGFGPRLMRGGGIGMVCGGPLPWMEEEKEQDVSSPLGEVGDSITKSL